MCIEVGTCESQERERGRGVIHEINEFNVHANETKASPEV